MRQGKVKIRWIISAAAVLAVLAASIAQNIWYYCCCGKFDSYLQDTDEIYTMESGILMNNLEFLPGEDIQIRYDLTNPEYPELIEVYGIDRTAGEGSELDRALRLMDEYSGRLTHHSTYDNHVEMSAMALLDYSLDNREHGINCRSKAQILNEMCLALGICSRKVWILPYSGYDCDCHVVNEIWDSTLDKWVMLDITNNEYWVDDTGTPLSVLEIRERGARQEFCTPVKPGEDLTDPAALKERHLGEFLYIMKNMVYIQYCDVQTVGETEIYTLFPVQADPGEHPVMSVQAAECPPSY